jgi:hypothetical protein
MPDDSPQPQPATEPERSEEQMLSGAIRDLAAQPSHPMTQFILGRAADTIDLLLAEKARAEADAARWRFMEPHLDVIYDVDEVRCVGIYHRVSFKDYGLSVPGGYASAAYAIDAAIAAATLAATAPAATETKEQENAR